MDIRGNLWRVPAGGALLLLVAAVVVGVLLSNASGGTGSAGVQSASVGGVGAGTSASGVSGSGSPAAGSSGGAVLATARVPDPVTTLLIGQGSVGQPIAPGFLGFSFEFQAVRAYTGDDPAHINPVLVQLIRNLTPGQAPVLRIGGDSTDVSYAPAAGVHAPAYVDYRLGPGWMATTAALAHQLGARMIMGLNLAADQPALAAVEARDFLNALGAGSIEAFEIGNEPNVYGKMTAYHAVFGLPVPVRPSSFGYGAFGREFKSVAAAAPGPALAGPALAIGPTPGSGSWVQSMSGFLRSQQRVSIMTVHRYPLRNCYVPPASPQFPSVSHLLSDYSAAGLARSLKRWVQIAHGQHRLLRVDELNSVACRGKAGVSDTFASAMWVTDALFSLARAGVDGIDMHTLPDSAYELFSFHQSGGRWTAAVRPVYYGLQLFAQAAPAGSEILSISRHGGDGSLSTWATRAPDGSERLVLINKSQTAGEKVRIRLPGTGVSTATVERMLAPSAASHGPVTLGGKTYGAQTSTGVLPAAKTTSLTAPGGTFTVSVPRASAALLTFGSG